MLPKKKSPKQKRAGGVAQVIKYSPNKHKDLNSSPSAMRKRKKKKSHLGKKEKCDYSLARPKHNCFEFPAISINV
jgi:hypothetical protein